MANKEKLLERLAKLINKDQKTDMDEKERLALEAATLTKAEIQDAIDEYNDKKTSSSNEPKVNIEQYKDELHTKIDETSLTEEIKNDMHGSLDKLSDKQILKMHSQKKTIEEYIKKMTQTKANKIMKNAKEDPEADQILDEEKSSYRLDPKGKNLVVRVRQKEACRIFQEVNTKGSVTVICGDQKLVIPANRQQHVLYLDGALSLN